MEEPQILALADDATGALETGCRRASNGFPCEVWFVPPTSGRGRTLVISTQSRHCTPDESRGRVREALAAAHVPEWIFKKTDSTLRGPIATEIAAMLDHTGRDTAVYVPAYPAMGRTVIAGRLWIDGVPVEQTPFARDPLFPVSNGFVHALFAGSDLNVFAAATPADLVSLLSHGAATVRERAGSGERRRVLICDAATEDRVDEIAKIVASTGSAAVAAGPANFAGALARQLSTGKPVTTSSVSATRGLIVCGSRHPASLQQVDHAVVRGMPVSTTSADAATALSRRGWGILKPTYFRTRTRIESVNCSPAPQPKPWGEQRWMP